MNIQKADEMVTHIRAIMEQSQSPEELVAMNDVKTLALKELIANSLEQAVAMAVDNADESLFENPDVVIYKKADATGSQKSINTDGTITAPENLQRMIMLTSPAWTGVVRDIFDQSSPLYRICCNKYIKNAGVNDRPAAFNDFNDNGKKVIKIFPDGAETIKMIYIAKSILKTYEEETETTTAETETTTAETDDDTTAETTTASYQGIECDNLLYEAACYYCAYLVAMTQGWSNSSYYRQEAVQALRANVVTPTAATPAE